MRATTSGVGLAMVLACGLAHAAAEPLRNGWQRDPAASGIDAIFASYEKPGVPGCELGVVRDGNLAFERGYGLSALERATKIGPDTIFNIASMSKQFTAFAIFLLEARGRLSLQDSVVKYLPELGHYAAEVKLHHLLSHTSGVREYFVVLRKQGRADDDVVTGNDILQALARQRGLSFAPGSEFFYSNSGYFLLAEVVKRASGEEFSEFVAKNIFRPLGMTNTSIFPAPGPMLATAYSVSADGAFHAMHVPWLQIGESGVHTTLHDLMRWDANFRSPKVGSQVILARMLQGATLSNGEPLGYGGGLMIGEYRGLPTVAHSGYSSGFRSQLLRFPLQQLSVAVLCNRDDAEVERYAEQVAELYLEPLMYGSPRDGDLRQMISGGVVDVSTLPKGLYRDPHGGAYLRLLRNDGAQWLQIDGETGMLRPLERHIYTVQLQGQPRYVSAPVIRQGEPAQMRVRFHSKPADYALVSEWSPGSLKEYAGAYFAADLNVTYELVERDGGLALRAGDIVTPLRPGMRGELRGAQSQTIALPERGHDYFTYSEPGLRNVHFDRVRP